MNTRKVEMREHRLHRVMAQVEVRKQALEAKGLDKKRIEKDPTMRHLLAEARAVRRVIEALKWEKPVAEKAEKAEKPAKEAAQPKAPKQPKEKKEKKPKAEEQAPPA